MNQVSFVIPPLPADYNTAPVYSAAEPDIAMTITYPYYGDAIPALDTVIVLAEITGSKTVSKVEFYMDDTLVGTAASSPYTVSVPGPLSYAKHVLRIEATCTDGTKVINPEHVFYTVPSRDTVFHRGWNIGGPQVTVKGKAYSAAVSPTGDYVTDRPYNPNDGQATTDAELQVLLDTSVQLSDGENPLMRVSLVRIV
jgi:hypothetical protein